MAVKAPNTIWIIRRCDSNPAATESRPMVTKILKAAILFIKLEITYE